MSEGQSGGTEKTACGSTASRGGRPPVSIRLLVTREQRRVIYSVLELILTRTGRKSWALAIECACFEYVGNPRYAPFLPSYTEGPRRPSTFGLYPEQIVMFETAMERARGVGLLDDGQALAEICAAVIAPGGTYGPSVSLGESDADSARPTAGASVGDGEGPHHHDITGRHEYGNGTIDSASQGSAVRLLSSLCYVVHHRGHGGDPVSSARSLATDDCPPGKGRVTRSGVRVRADTLFAGGRGVWCDAQGAAGGENASPLVCAKSAEFPRTVGDLSECLRVPEADLREFARTSGERYARGRLRKRNGGYRVLRMPDQKLKRTQRALRALLAPHVTSEIAFDVRGRNQFMAAELHAGRPCVGKLDVWHFFDSVSTSRVRTVFDRLGCSPDCAELLVKLTTYRGCLPQGAPTSPVVAHLFLTHCDEAVATEARRCGLRVSRFADDFTVSGTRWEDMSSLLRFICQQLALLGLRENREKRSIQLRHEATTLGLSLCNGVCVPKKWRKRVQDDVRRVRRYGCSVGEWQSLRGRIAHLGRLHPRHAARLRKALGPMKNRSRKISAEPDQTAAQS